MKKIPVWRTIAETYRFTFMGLERIIGAIWLPVLTITVGRYFVSGPYLSASAATLDGDFSKIGPAWVNMFGFGIVTLVLTAVIGVAITREILNPLKRPVFLRFNLGATEMRLAGAFVGIAMLMVLFLIAYILIAILLGTLLGSVIPATPGLSAAQRGLGIGMLIAICLSPVLVFLFVRLGFLVAPSVVMEGKFGIERSWQLTRGNVWRIIAIGLAVTLPLSILTAVLELLIVGPEYIQHLMGMFGDKAAQLQHSAELNRLVSAKLPFLMGLTFVLAPFSYGLTFAAPAIAYRALTGEGQQ